MQNLEDVLTERGIDFTGWTLRQATGVSADGLVIVGNGTNPEGRGEGWIIDLRDEESPKIVDASADKELLWPPNHRLVTVNVDALVEDDSGEAIWRIYGAECSEEHEVRDIQFIDDHTVKLRATRNGKEEGRMYTLWIEAEDGSGNLSELYQVIVTVPHDQRRKLN
jgi:hypothetical protein